MQRSPSSANFWWVAVCGQSIPALLPAASRRPPNTGPSCSSATCAAARWRPHTPAWRGRGRRKGGWWRAGGCPGPSSCRQAGAQQRWRTFRALGSVGRSPSLRRTTAASNSAGKKKQTGESEKRHKVWLIPNKPYLLHFNVYKILAMTIVEDGRCWQSSCRHESTWLVLPQHK